MAKFPSQNKIWYQTGSIGTGLTAITSGGTSGDLNLPKDLSLMNRRGYASTTNKGVPLIYRCKVDYYLQDEDQNGVSAAVGSDFASTLDIYGCQNNWVMRNAAVKWHAARENMFRREGVTKRQRGAYTDAIRYNYDSNGDSFVVPIDGDGDAFTGGTWDTTTLSTEADQDIELKLVGSGLDESSANTATALQIGHSYLMSRMQPEADSNLQTEETPADRSILLSMLSKGEATTAQEDAVKTIARDEQDNPPYELIDISDSGDVNHDITEPVLLGRCLASLGSGFGSAIVDIPFGLAGMKASLHDAAGTSVTSSGSICVEVIDIYEMMG